MAEPAPMPLPIGRSPAPADDDLKDMAEQLVAAVAGLAISRVTSSVDGAAGRLTDYAAHGGPGLVAALRGARPGGTAAKRPALRLVAGGAKDRISDALSTGSGLVGKATGVFGRAADDDADDDDDEPDTDTEDTDDTDESGGGGGRGFLDRVKGMFGFGGGGGGGGDDGDGDGDGGGGGGGGGGGPKGLKVTNIVETVDVGVPLRLAYNQWTQFQDFSNFMKKVESVSQDEDEKIRWQAKIFLSRRTWDATIVEQIPDTHIVWHSSGAKGVIDGAVSFHELSPNLTRILVVLEYSPKGLFEYIGNLWRAQGRRARLEIKHFRRYVMTKTILDPDAVEGWRGEIRGSEVVKTHEEALEEEREAREREDSEADGYGDEDLDGEYEDDEGAEDEYDDEDLDGEDADDEDADEDEPVDDVVDDDEVDAEYDDEDAEDADEPVDEAEEDEQDEEPARNGRRRGRRRAPARAGGRGR